MLLGKCTSNLLEDHSSGVPVEEIANGLVDVPEEALKLLQWALKIYRNLPGQQSRCSNGGASGVYSNRAGTYDALGRTNIDAIEILECVVGIRAETLGTANSEGKKRRLTELLKEEGRVRNRKCRSLETFLDTNLQLS